MDVYLVRILTYRNLISIVSCDHQGRNDRLRALLPPCLNVDAQQFID